MTLGDKSRLKICVSGAAETDHCGESAFEAAYSLGREIASQGFILTEGATTGFPLWAARGAKENGGIVIGFSPANTEKEHVEQYNLPIDYHDLIVYTGFGYSGRDLLLVKSSDAIINGCGRIGTIHEFTIAFEDHKPIGILEGEWETDELFRTILEQSHRAKEMENRIIFEKDPKIIVSKLAEIVNQQRS